MRAASGVQFAATVFFAVVPLLVTGCNPRTHSGLPPGPRFLPRSGPKVDARLVTANTAFGLKLFEQLRGKQPKDNVFISPASVVLALAMTYNGAAGDTQQAMAKTLELGAMTPADVNAANRALTDNLGNSDIGATLTIADSLWANKGDEFSDTFVATNKRFYDAELATLDFHDPRSAQTINDWTSKKTGGKIPQIVDSEQLGGWDFVLINAVYFSGQWLHEFDPSKTKDMPFTLLDGSPKQLPMMTRSGKYMHLKAEGFEAIRLPYGDQGLAMYVFLPDKNSSLAAFCGALTAQQWDARLKQFDEGEGSITLPRFRIEYAATLNAALTALGMGIAFDPHRADFGPLEKQPGALWIDEVLHKTVLEVDEKGTRAAAATAVSLTKGAMKAPSAPFNMVVDRPFLCAICDDQTKAILFVGAIVDPGKMG
jgi:serpin B